MPRKKRRSAWGSITSKSRDKHVLRWVEDTPEGRKRRTKTVRGTYREATLELARLRVEHAADRPSPTIGQAYSMWWLPWMKRRVADGKAKQRSLHVYESCWRMHIEPKWGHAPCGSIKPADVQEWLLTLPKGTAAQTLAVLRKVGDFCVQYEVADSNKFRIPYEMPSEKAYENRSGVLTLAQADTAFAAVRGSLIEAPFILACFGSARPGESCGVRASEIALTTLSGVRVSLAPIRRMALDTGCGVTEDGVLKNAQSVRTLAVPEPYGTRLAEIAAERIADGREWMADRGDGLPLNTRSLNGLWSAMPCSLGTTFASLRKSWRTLAQYEWGVDYDTLELLMGHKLPGVTGKHYLKPTDEMLAETLARAYAKFRELG